MSHLFAASTFVVLLAAAAAQTPAPPPAHVLHWNVAVLVFEGVELLDFAGPVEAFTQTRGFDPPMTVYTVGIDRAPLRTGNVVRIVPDYAISDCPPPDILVIPGGEVRELEGGGPLAHFLRTQVPRVQIAFSVCNGAFALAAGGFLDGLEATTFHSSIGWLETAAPRTKVHRNRRFVDNGHIVTAAGVSAGIDGALHLIHRLLGADMARRAATRMEYRWADDPGTSEAPANPTERARQLWYAGRWKEALPEYAQLVADDGHDAIATARLGTCQLFERCDGALATLEKAATMPGNAMNASLWSALGWGRQRAGRAADAIPALERALALAPDSNDIRHSLGLAQAEGGRPREGVANLEATWAKGVGDWRTLVARAAARLQLGDEDGALTDLELAAADDHAGLAEELRKRDFGRLDANERLLRIKRRAEDAARTK